MTKNIDGSHQKPQGLQEFPHVHQIPATHFPPEFEDSRTAPYTFYKESESPNRFRAQGFTTDEARVGSACVGHHICHKHPTFPQGGNFTSGNNFPSNNLVAVVFVVPKRKGLSILKKTLDMYQFFGRWKWPDVSQRIDHEPIIVLHYLVMFSINLKIWKLTGLREKHPRTVMYIHRSNVYQTKKNCVKEIHTNQLFKDMHVFHVMFRSKNIQIYLKPLPICLELYFRSFKPSVPGWNSQSQKKPPPGTSVIALLYCLCLCKNSIHWIPRVIKKKKNLTSCAWNSWHWGNSEVVISKKAPNKKCQNCA